MRYLLLIVLIYLGVGSLLIKDVVEMVDYAIPRPPFYTCDCKKPTTPTADGLDRVGARWARRGRLLGAGGGK